jgi:hypothetical protein
MTEPSALFRKTALDKLSSPERLDVLMTLTAPRAWLALWTVVGLMGGLVAWSVLGSIPTRAEGDGVLIRDDGLREIRAASEGVIVDLTLKTQDAVRSGMKIGLIKQYGSNQRASAAPQEGQTSTDMELLSTVEGRVVEVRKASGDRVQPTDIVAVVEPMSEVSVPVVYMESTIAKKIHKGMEAQITPLTVKREEFGFLPAVVTEVGDYPVTPEQIAQVVGNESLARELLGRSSKIAVRFALMTTNDTPSGYRWSSSSGPPFRIDRGTRLTAAVVVERRKPYTYVLPSLRQAIGTF